MKPADGRRRVVIEDVTPQIDSGRHPLRRVPGEEVEVNAAIFADGKDTVAARACFTGMKVSQGGASLPCGAWGTTRGEAFSSWTDSARGDIRSWDGSITLQLGQAIWRSALPRRPIPSLPMRFRRRMPNANAGPEFGLQSRSTGYCLGDFCGRRSSAQGGQRGHRPRCRKVAPDRGVMERLAGEKRPFYENPCDEQLMSLMARYPGPDACDEIRAELPVRGSIANARDFHHWYEIFPRSASPIPGRHGTFTDVERQLPEIARDGFRYCLSSAYSSHRPSLPEGAEQLHCCAAGCSRQPLGHRRGSRAARHWAQADRRSRRPQIHSSPAGHVCRF